MTWTRLSDDFTDRPNVLELSDAAFRLHVSALVYGNRMTTDGYVPSRVLRRLTDGHTDVLTAELVESGLWAPENDGFRLDWTDQESAETVQARRAAAAQRMRTWREKQQNSRGEAVTSAVSDGVTDGASSASVTLLPTRSRSRSQERRAGGKNTQAVTPSPTAHEHRHVFDAVSGYCGCGVRDDHEGTAA